MNVLTLFNAILGKIVRKRSMRMCEYCTGDFCDGFNLHCPHCGRKPSGLTEVGN